MKTIRSRILEFFTKECLNDLYQICMSKKIRDNNSKVDAVNACLEKHKVDYVELGPGTNRYAILIDGYVFKIALDKWGIQDNINELTVSQELQPYVSKTYECNDLILVAEYVTVISREEFAKKRPEIEKVLAILAEGYLLGDVGIVPKNFCNWGYRDNGELVILDYAYIYRIIGGEMFCSVEINEDTGERCGTMLQYTENFHSLICPRCRTSYSFVDVRRRITVEHEKQENELAKQLAYKVTSPLTEFDDKEDNTSLNNNKNEYEEDQDMAKKKYYDNYDFNEDYDINEFEEEKSEEDYLLDALALMQDHPSQSEEDEVIGDMIDDIKEENATKAAINLVNEDEEFNKYTDEIDNIVEERSREIVIDKTSVTKTETTTTKYTVADNVDKHIEIHNPEEENTSEVVEEINISEVFNLPESETQVEVDTTVTMEDIDNDGSIDIVNISVGSSIVEDEEESVEEVEAEEVETNEAHTVVYEDVDSNDGIVSMAEQLKQAGFQMQLDLEPEVKGDAEVEEYEKEAEEINEPVVTVTETKQVTIEGLNNDEAEELRKQLAMDLMNDN